MSIQQRKMILMLIVLTAFTVPSLAYFLNRPSVRRLGVENLVLIYRSKSMIRIEYKPGRGAFFIRNPESYLTITPVGRKEEIVKLNFTLEVRGDAFLKSYDESLTISLDEILRQLKEESEHRQRPNITKNFYCAKSVIVDFNLKTREAYFNGKNIGILPFGITETHGNLDIVSVWLQDANSMKIDKAFPPATVARATPFGICIIDLSKGVWNITLLQNLAVLNLNKTTVGKFDISQLPPAFRKLTEMLETEKLELIIFSNASSSYLDYVFSGVRFEKTTGIPFDFNLPGGPMPVVEGANYLYNGRPIEYFPVVPLSYFLGIREHHGFFSLIDIK